MTTKIANKPATPTGKPIPSAAARKAEMSNDQAAGAMAQGHALAMRVRAQIVGAASDLRRIAWDALAMHPEALKVCHKGLTQWRNECRQNAVATITGGEAAKFSPKTWQKMANTATQRASQFQTITRAVQIGLDHETLGQWYGVKDPEEIGFDAIVKCAREFLNSNAAGSTRGRARDPFVVAAIKYINKKDPAPSEADAKAELLAYFEENYSEEYAVALKIKADEE